MNLLAPCGIFSLSVRLCGKTETADRLRMMSISALVPASRDVLSWWSCDPTGIVKKNQKSPSSPGRRPKRARSGQPAASQWPIYSSTILSELPPGLKLSEKIALSNRTKKCQFRAVRLKNGRQNALATETQLPSARHPLTASQQEW